MSAHPLADAFGHHVWATLRLIEACSELSPEQLDASVPGTYGSILDTLRHTVGADRAYLWVLSDGALPALDEEKEATMDLAELRAVMEDNGPAWSSLLAAKPDPERVVVRHRDDGSDSFAPAGIRLAQVLHHGTDHRSQACTAITSLGIEPPEIDVWSYGMLDGRVHQTEPTS